MNARSAMCKVLALVAWALATVWFGVATIGAWGFAPAGLAWWSFLGLPLALRTLLWLRSAGAPLSSRLVQSLGTAWLLLLVYFGMVVLFGDQMSELNPFYAVLDVASLLFPIVLFVVVLIAIIHLPTTAGPTA